MTYRTVALHSDPAQALHRLELFPRAALAQGVLPALSLEVLEEGLKALAAVAGQADDEPGLSHVIVHSGAPAFALGADLAAVVGHLERAERSELRHYLHTGCQFAHALHGALHPRVHSMAVVQGTAMGGGFEVALACETLVAERSVKFGLPETVFGSFAGCGAPSFLARLVGPTLALRMLRSGKTWQSEDLQAVGILEHLVDPGQAMDRAIALVQAQRAAGSTLLSLKQVQAVLNPVPLEELKAVADIWVEGIFSLSPAQRHTMRAIVDKQRETLQKRLSSTR